ncbi:MAG: LLM class flavin-dependent oxidoreductase [Pseudonocardia sp.]|uniref:LLM class flavin-dependent oxidoreductase n=1 Tax=unclassified Pseudonocardia TaxID=2619320 RepID=UPI001ACFB01F|nr:MULTISPECIES: LLM class flavin-dependent oxidoreductase [unclassified Pseudonocardia]MBN9110477.1 LLM class flavin-dependent oxidoreductase [Pseudonocardia sp.]
MDDTAVADDTAATSPMRNDNPMKLGVFCFNASGGTSFTTVEEGRIEPSWAQTVRIARAADEAGWEFLLPLARWRGFGGATDHNGASFEVFTWASAVSAVTERIQVFATAQVPLTHPIVAAKQAATIDHVGGGRFGLNVVVGWNAEELGMFGIDQRPHTERYAYAAEWLELIDRLWAGGPVDHEGHYFTVRGADLRPRPVQQRPVIINAGSSVDGMNFIARHCDFGFQAYPDLPRIAEMNAELQTRARAHGREVGVVNTAYVVCADTEREARRIHDHYVDDLGDWEAATRLRDQLVGRSRSHPEEMMRSLTRALVAGWGATPLVGTPEQITGKLVELHRIGTGGVALSWVDFEDGIGRFNAQVLPLMREAGLRR